MYKAIHDETSLVILKWMPSPTREIDETFAVRDS